MLLYRGVISSFNSHYTDLIKTKKEISIIKNVLFKMAYKVDYKPYLTENPRYADPNPIFDVLKNIRN